MKQQGSIFRSMGDRLLAIAFVLMAMLVIVGMTSGTTSASFTGTSTNPTNAMNSLTVQPPAAQNNASSAAAGVVQVSWTATPTAPGTGHTLTYLVFRGPVGGPYSQVGSTSGLTYNDTPPSDGSYGYVIEAQITGGGSFTSSYSTAKTGLSDRTAPTMSITCDSAACSSSTWYNAAVSVTVSGSDSGTGMGSVTRNVDSAGQTSTGGASATFSVSGDSASHSIAYFGTDAAGNSSGTATQTIKIDATAPTAPGGITLAAGSTSGTLNVSGTSAGTDALSGVAGYRVYYVQASTCPAAPFGASQYFAGNPPAVPMVLTGLTTKQNYCVYVHTVDNAGNESVNSNIAGPVKAK